MLYATALIFHILVACMTIVALAWSGYALIKGKGHWYKKFAVAIAVLAILETVSGFSLAVLSPTVTVAYVASHLVWYLGVCLIAEALLLVRIRAGYGLAK